MFSAAETSKARSLFHGFSSIWMLLSIWHGTVSVINESAEGQRSLEGRSDSSLKSTHINFILFL